MNEQAKDYLIKLIKEVLSFPHKTIITYSYNGNESIHILDIDGENLNFLETDDWQDKKYDIVDKFEELFINDQLVFTTKDSIVRKANNIIFTYVYQENLLSATYEKSSNWIDYFEGAVNSYFPKVSSYSVIMYSHSCDADDMLISKYFTSKAPHHSQSVAYDKARKGNLHEDFTYQVN